MAAKVLYSRESRKRWFQILDRKLRGKFDKGDLLHFAPKLELSLEQASSIFDRLAESGQLLSNKTSLRLIRTSSYKKL